MSFTSVGAMINDAIEDKGCKIHFKLIQMILTILAKQMRLLDRRVAIDIGDEAIFRETGSQLSLTEIKIKSKKKKKQQAPVISSSSTSSSSDQTATAGQSRKQTQDTPDKRQSIKSTSDRTSAAVQPGTQSQEAKDRRQSIKLEKSVKSAYSADRFTSDKSAKSEKYSKSEPSAVSSKSAEKTKRGHKTASETNESSTSSEVGGRGKGKNDRGRGVSTDYQQERLIVVESVGSIHGDNKKGQKGRYGDRTPKSVVTIEQYEKLAQRIANLHKLYGVEKPELGEKLKMIKGIQKKVSMSDPMALIQLSARLEQAERNLANMMTLLTDLANRAPGISEVVDPMRKPRRFEPVHPGTKSVPSAQKAPIQLPPLTPPPTKIFIPPPLDLTQEVMKKRTSDKVPPQSAQTSTNTGISKAAGSKTTGAETATETELLRDTDIENQTELETTSDNFTTMADEVPAILKPKKVYKDSNEFVNYSDFTTEIQEFYENLVKATRPRILNVTHTATASVNLANRLGKTVDDLVNTQGVVSELEDIIYNFGDRITDMDSDLSSHLATYQDDLAQMQYSLEVCLDNMAEALCGQSGDPEAVADLSSKLTLLAVEFHRTGSLQGDLADTQRSLQTNLKSIWKQLKVINQTKCNREEIIEKLKAKADRRELNGILTQDQFDAVQGYLQNRISKAYDKFNNTELIWQKVIDNVIKKLNDKAEIKQMDFFNADIKRNLDKLSKRLDFMLDVVGSGRKYDGDRQIFRNKNCISCSLKVGNFMSMPELQPLPPIEARPKIIMSEKGDADGKRLQDDEFVCYPKRPLRHPIGPRASICSKICGGKLLKHPEQTPSQSPSIMMILGLPYDKTKIPTQVFQKPCIPCNRPLDSIVIIKKIGSQECIKDFVAGPGQCGCNFNAKDHPGE